MTDDFRDEIQAINAIYDSDTIRPCEGSDPDCYILSIPYSSVTLRLVFPSNYPAKSPHFEGTQSTGNLSRKGNAARALQQAEEALRKIFTPGFVCLFELLQALESTITKGEFGLSASGKETEHGSEGESCCELFDEQITSRIALPHTDPFFASSGPIWSTSEPLSVKKSIFLARVHTVKSQAEAEAAVNHLISTDKRVAKATHNIMAYRIRSSTPTNAQSTHTANRHQQLVFQDYEDDGETAAGGRLLHLLQIMDVWNLVVVVSRWYGGIKLGRDRFRCISEVAREAIMTGGWIRGDAT